MAFECDTIAAIATPPGKGGVGIVRVSGPQSLPIALAMLKRTRPLPPRKAIYGTFWGEADLPIDQGIALFFPGPNSFTGEDVLELQGHGGPVVLDLVLQRLTQLGARLARPGEFSERAYLNDKLDLAQAEAIADLIEAGSSQAARSALCSLQGAFSTRIHQLVESITQLRIYVEAAIDFPEEEIDFLSDGKISNGLDAIESQIQQVLSEARQGALIREGMRVVICGQPNAGKSSLLNQLCGRDSAIVTDIEGTTRDVLREYIHLDGMPLHLIDTAGLRDNPDVVEQIGIERAWQELESADRILLLMDSQKSQNSLDAWLRRDNPEALPDLRDIWPEFADRLPKALLTLVLNKADLSQIPYGLLSKQPLPLIAVSAKTGEGLATLKEHLKACMGYNDNREGSFTARRRHLDALARAVEYIQAGKAQLDQFCAGELLAEDLRLAQKALGEITGDVSSDELLGKIFSSFCIGK